MLGTSQVVYKKKPTTHATVGVHQYFSEAPLFTNSIPCPKTDFDKNDSATGRAIPWPLHTLSKKCKTQNVFPTTLGISSVEEARQSKVYWPKSATLCRSTRHKLPLKELTTLVSYCSNGNPWFIACSLTRTPQGPAPLGCALAVVAPVSVQRRGARVQTNVGHMTR